MLFSVAIADRDAKTHNACFEDFADALASALRALGHDVAPMGTAGARVVYLGANDGASRVCYPDDAIFYNAEQVALAPDPLRLIAPSNLNRVIWDYSRANIARWREYGFERAVYCPVGYVSSMEKESAAERFASKDVDVLHYGCMSSRRRDVLVALQRAGLTVMNLNGVYGAERDRWIARSKVVLNVHYREPSIFEIFRCSHLFANRCCVVSEAGGADEELESLAKRVSRHVPYDRIVSECLRLVADDQARRDVADFGYIEFAKIDLVDGVRKALAESVVGA